MQHMIRTMLDRYAMIGAAVLFALGGALLAWHFWPQPAVVAEQPNTMLLEMEEPRAPAPTAVPMLVVYVTGAVIAPDAYMLPAGARVKDAVLAAGGLAEEADAEAVNLAQKVNDGQHVRVARHGEKDVAAAPNAPAATGAGALIDINSASAAELETLPGVGAAMAARIIEHRAANGNFAQVADLGDVKGIGSALITKIEPLVTVGP